MKLVKTGNSSGARQIPEGAGQVKQMAESDIVMDQGGFLTAYTVNESPSSVYIDNFQLSVASGGLLEENTYYPFGMINESLSNQSNTDPINNYKYNGKEVQNELSLQWLDYGARFYDPVIGRWHSIDPMAEKYRRWTPYNYCIDNPLRFIDPDGDSIVNIYRNKNNIVIVNSPLKEGGKNYNNTIRLETSVSQESITDYSAGVVNDAMNKINDNDITVTSGYRSPKDQARVMYDNLQSGSVEGEKDTYGPAGEKVIDSYVSALKQSKDPKYVIDEMLKTMMDVGPGNVSKHSSDPKVYNVFDISPKSVSSPSTFHKTLIKDPRVKHVWSKVNKPSEKAVHVEIPQP